jgi:hypothetical protein
MMHFSAAESKPFGDYRFIVCFQGSRSSFLLCLQGIKLIFSILQYLSYLYSFS